MLRAGKRIVAVRRKPLTQEEEAIRRVKRGEVERREKIAYDQRLRYVDSNGRTLKEPSNTNICVAWYRNPADRVKLSITVYKSPFERLQITLIGRLP